MSDPMPLMEYAGDLNAKLAEKQEEVDALKKLIVHWYGENVTLTMRVRELEAQMDAARAIANEMAALTKQMGFTGG